MLRRDARTTGLPEQLELWAPQRPRTRADCKDGPRPCPWVSCRYHLALDVKPGGAVTLNFPDREVWQLGQTCALDLAERGGMTQAAIGELLNISDERVRQLEVRGRRRMAAELEDLG
jgi:hypothetical protein